MRISWRNLGRNCLRRPMECGLLNGTFRAALLDEGKIRERVFTWEELIDARGLWRINSVRGWQEAVVI